MKNSENNTVKSYENLYINDISPLYVNINGRVSFQLDTFSKQLEIRNSILNFTGYAFSEMKHHLFEGIATAKSYFDVIITNTDILSQEHLFETLQEWSDSGKSIIIFYATEYKSESTASAKRCKQSADLLLAKGLKNVYFCQGLKEVKACLKSIKQIDVVFHNSHGEVVNLKKNVIKKEFSADEVRTIKAEILRKNKPKLTLINCEEVA